MLLKKHANFFNNIIWRIGSSTLNCLPAGRQFSFVYIQDGVDSHPARPCILYCGAAASGGCGTSSDIASSVAGFPSVTKFGRIESPCFFFERSSHPLDEIQFCFLLGRASVAARQTPSSPLIAKYYEARWGGRGVQTSGSLFIY